MAVHSVGSHICDIYGRPRNVPCPRPCRKRDSMHGEISIKPRLGANNFKETLRKGTQNFTLDEFISLRLSGSPGRIDSIELNILKYDPEISHNKVLDD